MGGALQVCRAAVGGCGARGWGGYLGPSDGGPSMVPERDQGCDEGLPARGTGVFPEVSRPTRGGVGYSRSTSSGVAAELGQDLLYNGDMRLPWSARRSTSSLPP